MNHNPPQRPQIPKTPLKIFVRKSSALQGPFYVEPPGLAGSSGMEDISDEEIMALAHLIYNAYHEWNQQ